TTVQIDTNGLAAPPTTNTPDSGNALKSIDCVSTTQCTAVDGKGNEVTFDPTTGNLTGALTSIDTNGGTGVALSSVSCPSASVCTAVDGIGNEVTFAPTATPAPSLKSIAATTFIAAVSCPSTGST